MRGWVLMWDCIVPYLAIRAEEVKCALLGFVTLNELPYGP